MIDVCICTHNPDPRIFERTIRGLCDQTISKKMYRVIIVDNKSKPRLKLSVKPLTHLKDHGIEVILVREELLGVAHARIRALKISDAGGLVFVDDDNILAANFLEETAKLLESQPTVGCFSGRVSLPKEITPPDWTIPLHGSLAIKDCGNDPIIDWFRGDWKLWVPVATASMVLRRPVIDLFLKSHALREDFFDFGRKGKTGLSSGEDFLIALTAADAGFKCGYFPQLNMFHHIHPNRFSFLYLLRLMKTYAKSDLMREVYLGHPLVPFKKKEIYYRLILAGFDRSSVRANVCLEIYQLRYIAGRIHKLLRAGVSVVARDN